MLRHCVGRVRLLKSALSVSYIRTRLGYMNLKEGMLGNILGVTQSGDKYAIEFDEEVFTNYNNKLSSFDNGCHGKGKRHHCIYIPKECVRALAMSDKVKAQILAEEESQKEFDSIDWNQFDDEEVIDTALLALL